MRSDTMDCMLYDTSIRVVACLSRGCRRSAIAMAIEEVGETWLKQSQ